jgi:PAS domain S-box-containing protein
MPKSPGVRQNWQALVDAIAFTTPCEGARLWVMGDAHPEEMVASGECRPVSTDVIAALRGAWPVVEQVAVPPHSTLLPVPQLGAMQVDAKGLSPEDLCALTEALAHFCQRSDAERFLESIVDNIPDMVFVKDAEDLRFVRLNRAAEKLLGLSEAEMLGKSDYDFFPKEEADFFTMKDREVLAAGTLHDIPEEPIHTTRGTRYLHTKKIPISGADGTPAYLLGISRDITERKQLEARLLQSQKLEVVARLAAGLTHDFNNAAMVITGYSDLALRKIDDSHELAPYLRKLKRASQRIASLSDKILGLAQATVFQPKLIDLGQFALDNAHVVANLVGNGIQVDVEEVEVGTFVQADIVELQQVLVNLTLNARAATSEGGTLRIGVRRSTSSGDPDQIHLSMADDGVGMPPDLLERAFDPFFTTLPTGAGTGLGLYSSLKIAERHEGTITLESTLGEGTTVTVALPAVEPPSSAQDVE